VRFAPDRFCPSRRSTDKSTTGKSQPLRKGPVQVEGLPKQLATSKALQARTTKVATRRTPQSYRSLDVLRARMRDYEALAAPHLQA
jgi:hypothetical protein